VIAFRSINQSLYTIKGPKMSGYNRVIMMGNLTRDPEFKELPSGQNICKLGIACNRQFKSRQNDEMRDEVCFVDIDVWGAQAESCKKYLEKGRQILVEGRLKLDSWQDSEGQRRSKHSIVADRVTFLKSGATDEITPSRQEDDIPRKAPVAAKSSGEVELKDEGAFDNDLPF
jgi:single-strand DNA-binding protein